MLNKKAQAAVAGVVLLIGILLVGFLAVLPKDEKCNIFPDLAECNLTANVTLGKNVFISEQPGLLEPLEESTEYDLGSIEVFNREVTELPLRLSADPSVESSWFNTKKIEQEFTVPGKVKKVILFVGISEASSFATLSIILNRKTVARVVGAGVRVVDLPNSLIQSTNILALKASTPFIPGKTNRFELNSLILKETYQLTQPEAVRNLVIEQDISDVRSAVLKFTADCYSVEPLKISLNNKTLTDEKICASYSNDVSNLLATNNRLIFSTQGNYFVHDAKLKIKFKKKDFPTYYFALNKEDFDKVKEGKVLAFLKLRFPDTANKQLTAHVNGNPINIETNKIEYKTAIGRLLLQGQNSVKLVPETVVNVGSLEIYFE